MSISAKKKLEQITGSRLTLGGAIRAIRLSEGHKQGKFAQLLGVTQSYLSDLENDRKEVSSQKALQFAKILKQSKKQFVRLALQDALSRQGIYYEIELRDVA